MVQDTCGISMHNQHGACLGTVMSNQINQLLSVLNSTNLNDKFSQIAGSTLCFADGTASKPKSQPHLIPDNPLDIPPSGNLKNSHFIYAGMENGLIVIHAAWVIDTGASCHVCADLG